MSEQNIIFSPKQEITLTTLPPLSLYIHIPWCIQKCPYCDFNSHQIRNNQLPETEYITALLTDLENELPYIWGRPIHTLFLGGGTPSVFSPQAIDTLLSGIRSRVKLLPNAEITLEANPGTFEKNRFQGYAAAGINRLSIGVQSFNNPLLKIIGRIHTASEALHAIDAALPLFDKVNIDLMYALPNQTPQVALQDVQTAIQCGVRHISAYHLTMEPNTPFGRTPPNNLPSDDTAQDIEDIIHECLNATGFNHYETSAFAQRKQECQHNINYWQFGDYIGIGAGAHGKISSANSIIRTTRTRHPKEYLHAMHAQPNSAINRYPISIKDLPFEFMMNTLRLTAGVPTAWFEERTGLMLTSITPILEKAVKLGLIHSEPQTIQPTLLGRRFLNDLLTLFLPD